MVARMLHPHFSRAKQCWPHAGGLLTTHAILERTNDWINCLGDCTLESSPGSFPLATPRALRQCALKRALRLLIQTLRMLQLEYTCVRNHEPTATVWGR